MEISDIKTYLNSEFYAFTECNLSNPPSPLLQKNFGNVDDLNCTLVSLSSLLMSTLYSMQYNYYEIFDIYKTLQKYSKKYFFYNPKIGTNPLFNKYILSYGIKVHNKTINRFKARNTFIPTFYKISEIIRKNNSPVALSFACANNGYYSRHTVTVIGTISVIIIEKKLYIKKFLKVLDNWNDSIRFIDWDTIRHISSATYITKK